MVRNVNKNIVAPVNGYHLTGEIGIQALGAQDWVTVANGLIWTLQFLLKGVAADCTVQVQACLLGGEGTPFTIKTVQAADGTILWTDPNKAYDKIRINTTHFTATGKASKVLMSVRP